MTRAMPCYQCKACTNKDCMNCKWCLDKKKYGGPGRLNKRCITRRCTNTRIVATNIRNENDTNGSINSLTRFMPCRKCDECLKEDCGDCSNCKDKRIFGGPGRRNKKCKLKICLTPKQPGDPSTVPDSYVRRQEVQVNQNLSYLANPSNKSSENNIEEEEPPEEVVYIF